MLPWQQARSRRRSRDVTQTKCVLDQSAALPAFLCCFPLIHLMILQCLFVDEVSLQTCSSQDKMSKIITLDIADVQSTRPLTKSLIRPKAARTFRATFRDRLSRRKWRMDLKSPTISLLSKFNGCLGAHNPGLE